MKTKKIIICALFAAIISITAPIGIPVGTVPVTMALFSVALTAFFAGSRYGVIATGIYMVIGLAGLPVFSGFRGGFGAIMSPTGGFILSYVFVAAILGIRTKTKRGCVAVCVAALLVCYVCGTLWYMFVTKADVITALGLCVVPFIVFDAVKLYVAYIVAREIQKRVLKDF